MTTSETLCILFNDIVSSTEHLVALGERNAESEFQEYREVTQRLVDEHGGHHYGWRGDGFLAAFNSTASGLEVAVELQRLSNAGSGGFVSRTGLAVGEVATQADGELFGRTMVIAARLCDLARGAQVLCTRLVSELVAHHSEFMFENGGDRVLKGIPETVPTVTVHRPVTLAVEPKESAVLIGRGEELRRLTDRLTEAVGGAGGLTLVSGEPGAGKTRLVREIANRAEMRGFSSIWSTAFAGGGSTALTVTNALVGQLRRLNLEEPEAAGHGSVVLPITELVGSEWDESSLSPGWQATLTPTERRAMSFDAVWRLIARQAADHPLLVVFDDLHWAEKGVADLVRFLGQRARTARVMLVVIYRTTEIGVDDLIDHLLEDVYRHAQELVPLDRLSSDDATTLGEVLTGGRLDDDLRSYLYGATDGNPFFLEELIRHLVRTGAMQRNDAGWHLTPAVRGTVPPSVRHQLDSRLRALGHLETVIVERIAAAERAVLLGELLGLADQDPDRTIQTIERALASGILVSTSDGGYDFSHPLLRDCVAEGMSDLKLAVLRRELGEWLASTPDAALAAAEIAQLFYRSRSIGPSEVGVDHALLGARQAENAGDSSTAANLFRLAREMLPTTDRRQIDLACSEALALTWSIDDRAAEAVIDAADLVEAAGLDAGGFLADAVGATRQAYSSVASLRRVIDRGMSTLGNVISAEAAVVRLYDMAFGKESQEYPGIEPQNPLVMSLYDAVEASPYQDIHRWGHRVRPTSVLSAPGPVEPDIRLYYAGDLSAIDDLRAAAATAERFGRHGRAAALWTTAARCAVARGELTDVDELVASAEEDLKLLSAEADVRYQLLAVTDELNAANGEQMQLETIRVYDSMVPDVTATFMLANFRSSIGRLYADVGEFGRAVELFELTVPAIERSGPAAATYLKVLWNAAEIVWHVQLPDQCELLRSVYEEQVIPGSWRTPMTNEYLALARLASVGGDLDGALESFELARQTTEEDHALPLPRPVRLRCCADPSASRRRCRRCCIPADACPLSVRNLRGGGLAPTG